MNCSFYLDNSLCGAVGSDSTAVSIESCNVDISEHLLSLGIGLKRGLSSDFAISESELILNRAGYVVASKEKVASMTICPKHRRELTVDWPGRKRFLCGYPGHVGKKKQIKNPRRVNMAMSQDIYKKYGTSVPVGTGRFHSRINLARLFLLPRFRYIKIALVTMTTTYINRVIHECYAKN